MNVCSIESMNHLGQIIKYTKFECAFGYRKSRFQEGNEVILNTKIILERGDKRKISQEMLSILRDRRSKFPLEQPNCGSVFVSSPEMYNSIGPPEKIIELAGLKGKTEGGAMVSPKHANFIVNFNNASSKDILN